MKAQGALRGHSTKKETKALGGNNLSQNIQRGRGFISILVLPHKLCDLEKI
jgi:hypothetical protein